MLIVFALVLAACADSGFGADPGTGGPTVAVQAGSASDVARAFLDAWTKGDYNGMYALISPKSQLISAPAFVETYAQVDLKLGTPADQGKRYSIQDDRTRRQGSTTVVKYDMTFTTPALGEFSDPDRTMRLILTQQGTWRVAWSTMDIFEGMAGGATLEREAFQPERGTIYDRKGQPLAKSNTLNYAARILTRSFPTGEPGDCYAAVQRVFRIPYTFLDTSYTKFSGMDYGFMVGTLDEEGFARYRGELDSACSMEYIPQTTRFYWGNGIAAQTIGYVSPMSAEQRGTYPSYPDGALVGQMGIERAYETELAGTAGARLVIRTPDGTAVRTLTSKAAVPGQDVTLTIDRDLQAASDQAIADAYSYASWATESPGMGLVALDANSGQVLALSSYPTFNQDAFLLTTAFDKPDTVASYVRSDAPEYSALRNRVVLESYPPASTFKIVSMVAAAESGAFKVTDTYRCDGLYEDSEGRVREDWIYNEPSSEVKNHGLISLKRALTASCDPYFWHVAERLNAQDANLLRQYGNQMGMGVPTGIDALDETDGLIPDPAYIQRTAGRGWGAGDNMNVVIGQGDTKVTPLQSARMTMGIANGGSLYTPYLVLKIGRADGEVSYVADPDAPADMGIKPDVMRAVQGAMCEVVNLDNIGTAWWVFKENWDRGKYEVCGKTGTAQNQVGQRPTGWFVAYAGLRGSKPDLAISAVALQGREGSETAAPIVRRVIESYYGIPYGAYPEFWAEEYVPMVNPGSG